jgi:sarcosine oxidase
MTTTADVLILGLGAAGAAAAWQCATRGASVIGIDRWAPPHGLGSSFGRTRIIREAYYEHPLYVPFLRRAWDLWDALAEEAGRELLVTTGGAMIGRPDGELVAGALASAREHGIEHELLDAASFESRYPGYHLEPAWVALVEKRAGLLLPEVCIESFHACARARGADLRTNERAIAWKADRKGVVVETDRSRYSASRLVIAAGAWLPQLVPELASVLEVERQVLMWFEPTRKPERFDAEHSPIALWEFEPGRIFATFPDLGDGFKAGLHHGGPTCDPETLDRSPIKADERAIRWLLARLAPETNGALRDACVCMYTNTPDHHFVIDRHPYHEQVVIASACSGHGFKFASATGELVAELVLDGGTRLDLTPFAVQRLLREAPVQ